MCEHENGHLVPSAFIDNQACLSFLVAGALYEAWLTDCPFQSHNAEAWTYCKIVELFGLKPDAPLKNAPV